MWGLLFGFYVQRLPAINLHLLLPHLFLNDAQFPGELGRLLFLGLQLSLNLLPTMSLGIGSSTKQGLTLWCSSYAGDSPTSLSSSFCLVLTPAVSSSVCFSMWYILNSCSSTRLSTYIRMSNTSWFHTRNTFISPHHTPTHTQAMHPQHTHTHTHTHSMLFPHTHTLPCKTFRMVTQQQTPVVETSQHANWIHILTSSSFSLWNLSASSFSALASFFSREIPWSRHNSTHIADPTPPWAANSPASSGSWKQSPLVPWSCHSSSSHTHQPAPPTCTGREETSPTHTLVSPLSHKEAQEPNHTLMNNKECC